MLLTTSKGNTYNALWVAMVKEALMLEVEETGSISDIAREFEGLEWLQRESKEQGDEKYEGFSTLAAITMTQRGIQCKLIKGGRDNL